MAGSHRPMEAAERDVGSSDDTTDQPNSLHPTENELAHQDNHNGHTSNPEASGSLPVMGTVESTESAAKVLIAQSGQSGGPDIPVCLLSCEPSHRAHSDLRHSGLAERRWPPGTVWPMRNGERDTRARAHPNLDWKPAAQYI